MKKLTLFCFTLLFISSQLLSQSQRVEKIISQMSLEEKIDFIGGYNSFYIRPYEKYGIPQIRMADGPVGVRNYGKGTSFPAGINLAATFNKQLAYNTGKAIGAEARSKNVQIMLGPGINIYRLPPCGRNFEYFGEDPYLTGQLAKEYIIGMQNEGVMACVKHYAANNQEYERHRVSSDVDLRTLHEIYLPGFKSAIVEGKSATVMTAYNLVNGIHCSEHEYLNNEVLKDKWGFDGFIMSDWVSTYDGLGCAKGGLDLEMPSGKMMNRETLIPAVKSGDLDEEVINDKIRRILNGYERFGFFENPDRSKDYELDEEFVRKASLQSAREGMVLLKNDNNFLPLKKEKIKTIAVIGPNGDPVINGGGGSSYVDPLHSLSLYEAVKKVAGNDIDVKIEKGIFTGINIPDGIFDEFGFYYYQNDEKVKGVKADFFNGKKLEGESILTTTFDKLDLTDSDMWNANEIPETEFSAKFSCFYTPEDSGQYCIAGLGDDGYKIYVDGVEIVSMWRDQGPSIGKKEMFLNAGQEYKVEIEYYQNGGGARIALGAKKVELSKTPEDYKEDAVKLAKSVDLVIMSVGFSNKTESEGFDRTFEMPYKQSEFINQIADVNKNIIVVLNSGGNVEMESWLNKVDALLMAWYPGQEGNLAAAEILFGELNPSGKLPVSFAINLEDNPTYNSYYDEDKDLRVSYDEGIFMGYRYWDKADEEPRFPFGYGLSYTQFEFSNIKVDKDIYSADEPVKVSVNVKNIGKVDGAEVVQLYVSDKESSLPRPIKELKGFEKVNLKSGEIKTVSFQLNKADFSYYDPDKKDWVLEPGDFEILIGGSSKDIQQNASIKIE